MKASRMPRVLLTPLEQTYAEYDEKIIEFVFPAAHLGGLIAFRQLPDGPRIHIYDYAAYPAIKIDLTPLPPPAAPPALTQAQTKARDLLRQAYDKEILLPLTPTRGLWLAEALGVIVALSEKEPQP